MSSKSTLNRREFIGTSAAAAAFTIVPSRVLGGPGKVAPSDKLNMALIGSGTMGINLMSGTWLPDERLQITCIADPNKDSYDYRDWSSFGIRNRIRKFLDEPTWGEGNDGIRGGRDCGKEIVDTYYSKFKGMSNANTRVYEDYRELLEQEQDIDGVFCMTPEHLHAHVCVAAMNKGKHAVSHKTLANVLEEVRVACDTQRATGKTTHLLAWHNEEYVYQLANTIRAGVIGTVREVHNWSNRPVWPQGWIGEKEEMPIPKSLNWDLWQGPCKDRGYHLDYTHALFRGWRDYGSGCLGDMGQYSLWTPYRILKLGPPSFAEGSSSSRCHVVNNACRQVKTQVAFPDASTIHFHHPANGDKEAVDIYWYDGGIRPQTPELMIDLDEEFGREGMMWIGDDGILVCDFLGNNPKLLTKDGLKDLPSLPKAEADRIVDADDEYVMAMQENRPSRGDFLAVQQLAEATCLGNLSVQFSKRLKYDSEKLMITNNDDANALLKRDYRPGWNIRSEE